MPIKVERMLIEIHFDTASDSAQENIDKYTKADFDKIADLAEDYLDLRPDTCYDGDLFCIAFETWVGKTSLVEDIYELFFDDAYGEMSDLLDELDIVAVECNVKKRW